MNTTRLKQIAGVGLAVAALLRVREARAQESPGLGAAVRREARNSVFVEVGGPGVLYSVNYDRMLSEMFSLRVGATYFQFHELHDDGAGYLLLPLVGNLLLGGQSHKAEFGVGGVPGWAVERRRGDTSGFQLNGVMTAGYRYAPAAGGVGFRANVEAMYVAGALFPWAGVSLGRDF